MLNNENTYTIMKKDCTKKLEKTSNDLLVKLAENEEIK